MNCDQSHKNGVKIHGENSIKVNKNKIDGPEVEKSKMYIPPEIDGLWHQDSNYVNYVALNQSITKQIASEQLINSDIFKSLSSNQQQQQQQQQQHYIHNDTSSSNVGGSYSHDAASLENRFSQMSALQFSHKFNIPTMKNNHNHNISQPSVDTFSLNASSSASSSSSSSSIMNASNYLQASMNDNKFIIPPFGYDFHPSGKAHVESKFKSRFKGGNSTNYSYDLNYLHLFICTNRFIMFHHSTNLSHCTVFKCAKKFKAQIQADRVQHYLGLYDTELEAALAYDRQACVSDNR
jgi:hypothetical protein